MLIIREMLEEAIREKKPLFHNGDEIDVDVLNLLLKTKENSFHGVPLHIKRDVRAILCSEMKSLESNVSEEGNVQCQIKCKRCGKTHLTKIRKSKLIYNTFHAYDLMHPDFILIGRKRISISDILYKNYHKTKDLYFCESCLKELKEHYLSEAESFLKKDNLLEWYNENRYSGDWKVSLLCSEIEVEDLKMGSLVVEISAADGKEYYSEEYMKELEAIEKKRKHEEELKKIRQERLVAEKEDRLKIERANELFKARHQDDTLTQRYINKFCNVNSDVNIEDEKIRKEALRPEGINFQEIQDYNSMFYDDYLRSPLWKIISYQIKKTRGFNCERCHSTKHLQVHHKSYNHKGVEFLATNELECLCAECHAKEHQKF